MLRLYFKNKVRIIFSLTCLACQLVLPTFSNANTGGDSTLLEFNITLRERFEVWDGMNAKNYGDPNGVGSLNDKILFQRIVAGFTFKPTSKIDFAAHIQDSRAFGWSLRDSEYPELFRVKQKNTQEPYYTMNPNEEFFEIYDLYFSVKEIFKGVSLKIGRQKISFGDKRIFGPGEWGNTGRWTWDAVRLSYRNKNNSLDVFGGGTKTHDPEKVAIPFTETEHWGGGAYAHIQFGKLAVVEPFYAIKTQGSADYIRKQSFSKHWIGTRVFSDEVNRFKYDFTLTQEFGHENGKTINAFGIIGLLGYQFHGLPAKPTLCLRETYASGGNNDDTRVRTFDPAFGAKDSYYGRMNITSWSNLDDREVVLYLTPSKKFKIEMNYHFFYLPSPDNKTLLGTMKLQAGKHHLGNEFNFFASYNAGKQFQFVGVFGYFWAGDLQPINGTTAQNSNWFAIQAFIKLDKEIHAKH
ncbi:alginate export family protein [Tenuifilum sp.]|uniref:alginate export family protein n=1 Tax=Tenuifilum sp. TaxID=2760880 RepID=UPI001B7112F5|nr:alginate export family protein [Bacteroidales bacterium]HOU73804.1 alginate export family protein [Tenuifilum sp.]MBP9028401.1 alginate export family protein [Bacteroidales bacterium]HQE53622.1 alginate export family protein [Tenuifilum sp.]HQG71413.1 alginate export family protein [Tenuifilum sp.]